MVIAVDVGCTRPRSVCRLEPIENPFGPKGVTDEPHNCRVLTTARLRLRDWRDEDLAPWAELNADSRVREFFPKVLTFAESAAQMQEARAHIARHGFGPWTLEVIGGAPFIGFIGLSVPSFEAHFTPCVELGYRLAFDAWGHGYATEGARAALRYGFETLGLPEIVAFTTESNWRSRRVMERLAMHHDPADDFDHPKLPHGHPLRAHVLYRLSKQAWLRLAGERGA